MKRSLCAVLCLALLIAAAIPPASANSPVFYVDQTEGVITEAKAQFRAGDRTPEYPPIPYRILWIGYTHVRYNSLDFRMTTFDREYLRAVTLNFEKYVEKVTSRTLDIRIDLFFTDREVYLTKVDDDDWLYLTRDTAMPEIEYYVDQSLLGYDTVLTTVQTGGEANRKRNEGKRGYGVNYVMLGVETHGIESDRGYSTFDLGEPFDGTYPLKDPEVPSLFATAVAVHEWLHQLEYLGSLLGIEYPSTHAYMGPPEFPGYKKIVADKNNYDFFEFYEQVLKGTVPYRGGNGVQYVGMYPRMWKLAKRASMNYGTFAITNARGEYLAVGPDKSRLTLSKTRFLWTLRYAGNRAVIISPRSMPSLRLDLDNGWDNEDNTVKVMYDTGWLDAQRWVVTENSDGSFCIRTFFPSRRALSVSGVGGGASIRGMGAGGPDASQRWYFTLVDEKY